MTRSRTSQLMHGMRLGTTFLSQSDADTLSALRYRPAEVEPAFGQIALPDADVEAVLRPRPDLVVRRDLQHELPVVGAREVRRALPSVEGAPGLPRFVVIRPVHRSALPLHAFVKGLARRVVSVVVISELDAIHLNRVLHWERNATDLVGQTVQGEHVRVLRSEILPKLRVSFFLFLPPTTPSARPWRHRLVGERRGRGHSMEGQELTGAVGWW